MPQEDFANIRSEIPYKSPVNPVELNLDTRFQFNCHKGVSCFNVCCKNIDITLTPYDIIRLKRRMDMTSSEWVARYALPFPMDAHEMPGLKLAIKPGATECVFLTKDGCGVYQDRPTACRFYALGSMGVKRQNESVVDDVYFVVKEEHCKGHEEPQTLTVREYLAEQRIDEYDEKNREWRDIVIKKRSSGPTVGKPSERSLQLFDMCSYDMDSFRKFIQSEGFGEVFDLGQEEKKTLVEDEDKLYSFACRFLKQVLFGENSIPVHETARETQLDRRRQRQVAAGDDKVET